MSSPKINTPNNFDSLRLIFAVLVIFSHSFPMVRGSNATEPLSLLTNGQVNFGNISVWAFFVISGFLITQSWQRSPNVVKFLKRRIARIYPAFIVTAVLSAFIFVPLVADSATYHHVSIQNFVFNTLRLRIFDSPPIFVHNALPNELNGSLWSVAYEFWCYLGVMTLGLVGLLRRRSVVVLLFVAVIGLHLYMNMTGWAPSGSILGQIVGYPPFWATVLPFYLAGTLFHLFGGHTLLRRPWIMLAAVVLIASNFVPHGLIVTMPICGSYLLMALAYLPLLHPLNLGRFGDFSYGTYLYAFPIQQLLVQRAHGQISPLLLFAEAAPITLIAGALSWLLVERHFLKRSSVLKHEGLLPAANTSPQATESSVASSKDLLSKATTEDPMSRTEGEAYAQQ
ncbi:acyltransferase family protein [Acidicapsa ligni]|uniref:acyltransferase family protein n=1 Tax=Acidicapsa ligni TaxID=542300 RepID=UPI0021E08EFA|nr:acyltransferase [Acidicapsa ligni]